MILDIADSQWERFRVEPGNEAIFILMSVLIIIRYV